LPAKKCHFKCVKGVNINKRLLFNRYLFIFALVIAGGTAFTASLSYFMIKKFTSRPRYSAQRIAEHKVNHERLLHEFNAQQITFKTDDNINLAGFLFVREGAQCNIVVCHGFRMAKERMLPFVQMFPNDNILLFDYRAHGESEGEHTTIGFEEKKDVHAALTVFKNYKQTKRLPIYGIGVSMGAVSLLGAASECDDFKAIVLDSPFKQLDEQARRTFAGHFKLPIIPLESLSRRLFEYLMQFSLHEVNSLHWAERVKAPVFFIHAAYDHIASIDDTKQLYEKIKGKKDMWVLNENGHARIFYDHPDEYQKRVHEFFDKI
jgi:uncharacterized protein